jgi:hypothetical protein
MSPLACLSPTLRVSGALVPFAYPPPLCSAYVRMMQVYSYVLVLAMSCSAVRIHGSSVVA